MAISSGPRTPPPTPRSGTLRALGTLLAVLVLVVLVVIGLVVLVTAAGVLLPGTGVVGDVASLAVPAYGPSLVVVGVVAAVIAWLLRRRLRRRLRRTATAVATGCAAGTAALAVVVVVLVVTGVQAGGMVDDPLRALAPTGIAHATPDEHPVYTTGPDGQPLHLAVNRPRGGRGPAPVLVNVHGGGWVSGSELGRAADLRRLADHGWLTVSVEYTLARDARPTWDLAGPQVACALAEVAAHAAERGADPSRIVLLGDSAGGQLVVSVGYRAASGTQPSSCGGTVPIPRAVVADYPAVDLVDGYRHGRFPGGGAADVDVRRLAITYTGGTPEQVPDRYRAVSGAAAITRTAPPTLVLGPAEDSLVPPPGVARFVDAAHAAGVDARLVRLPFVNHAYDLLADGSLGQQAGITLIERWADEHVR